MPTSYTVSSTAAAAGIPLSSFYSLEFVCLFRPTLVGPLSDDFTYSYVRVTAHCVQRWKKKSRKSLIKLFNCEVTAASAQMDERRLVGNKKKYLSHPAEGGGHPVGIRRESKVPFSNTLRT